MIVKSFCSSSSNYKMKCIEILIVCIVCSNCAAFIVNENKKTCEVINENIEVCKARSTLLEVNERLKLNSLFKLTINDPNITDIAPLAFKNVRGIKKLILELSSDKLNLEPKTFTDLSNLESLEINSGIFLSRDNLFQELKNLRHLSLIIKGNEPTFQKNFSTLEKLTHLSIHNSNLQYIGTDTFKNIESPISSLTLMHDHIAVIDEHVFNTFKNLTTLIIIGNDLIRVQSRTFTGLDNLVFLSLAMNKLFSIEANVFSVLGKLKILELNDNFIRTIHNGAFWGLKLKSLNLRNNYLTVIEATNFVGSVISSLNLAQNRIIHVQNNAFSNCLIQNLYIYNHDENATMNLALWGLKNSAICQIADKNEMLLQQLNEFDRI